MTPIFDVFFDILAKWEKLAEKNMFFERSIFNDFLDAKKIAPRSHRNHWVVSLQGVWAPWGTRGKQLTTNNPDH